MTQNRKNMSINLDNLKGYQGLFCFDLCAYNWQPDRTRRNIMKN